MPQTASSRRRGNAGQKQRADDPPDERPAPVEVGEVAPGLLERQRRARAGWLRKLIMMLPIDTSAPT